MLEGLKVIEMATYVAAPAAGAMLRDWGAEVIKVEPLNGCPMRRFFEGMKSNVPIEGNPIFTRRHGEDGGDDEKKLPRPKFHIDTS